jgi:DNA-binding MarR family transcriptional regulator
MSFHRLGAFVERSTVRVKILEDLSKGPKTPTELASLEHEHLSHVSRALAELRAQGLVQPMPSFSRERYYTATRRGFELYAAVVHMVK